MRVQFEIDSCLFRVGVMWFMSGQFRLYRPLRLLTYMATIIHLAQQEQVFKLDAALSWREQEERRIYVFPGVRAWMMDTLPDEVSGWNIELSPLEQLDNFLEKYCSMSS